MLTVVRSAPSRTRGSCPLTAAHLLCNHNCEGSQGCATNSRDCEQLDETTDVGGLPFDKRCFHTELGKNVVQIAGSLELGVSKAFEGGEGVAVFALLDIPTGRF
jgi:hypothetical protein